MNDLPKYAKRGTLEMGVLRADELIDFPAFFQRVVGRAPPAVLYTSRRARSSPPHARRCAQHATKETYRWILELVEAGHFRGDLLPRDELALYTCCTTRASDRLGCADG